jgi:hypothetical protein
MCLKVNKQRRIAINNDINGAAETSEFDRQLENRESR